MGKKLTGHLGRWVARAVLAGMLASGTAEALDRVVLRMSDDDRDLREVVTDASLVVAAKREGRTDNADVFAAALSDYARLLEALYAEGYYGGVISILVDGREAAEIPLLRTPERISVVDITVRPGPLFRFGRAAVGPLVPGTILPQNFRPGRPARAAVIANAVKSAGEAWRQAGHAKVQVAAEHLTARHRDATLDAVVALNPGPTVRFGTLVIETPSRVRAEAIRRIAGLPEGKRFDPDDAKEVAQRLRRTGAFASVVLDEAETLGPGNSMDMHLSVVDQKPRRFGFGAELSSLAGLEVTGFWMHRNAFGGAERLRFDVEVSNIGGDAGLDYAGGVRLEYPAPIGPDTRAFTYLRLEHLEEPDFTSDSAEFGVGLGRRFSDRFDAEVALAYEISETTDDFGNRTFSLLSLPSQATFDSRDDALDAAEGFYLRAEVTPFLGLNATGSGVRSFADGRAYHGFGADDRVVLAGRLQVGSVIGPGIPDTHPDFLFFSGGAGTVRGQPYESLNVDLGGGVTTGGRSFVGLSGEVRTRITGTIGAVAFADAGYVGAESFYDGSGEWHAGAGLGLRYLTGLGPIRLDVATPVGGDTGDGIQLYLGIGQAF